MNNLSPKTTLEAFEKAYKGLNPEQKRAVDTIEGPVLVIAGPGTGKTQILTLRIANILLKTDTPASGILAITFTDAGVKAMRKRLHQIIGARSDEVKITTFHGFASSVITEFDEHFKHLADSAQITDIEAENLLREILKAPDFSSLRPAGEPEFYISKITGAMSDAKREAWTPDIIRSHAQEEIERIKNDEDSLSTRGPTKGKLKAEAEKRIEKCERTIVFANVYEAYEQKKREEKKIDFDDLIIEVLVALKNDELLLRLIQEKYLYVLVDEHQDTNDAQNLLVKMIVSFFDNPNIFVVGDEKQAIYRFQGASVENFLSFQKTWKNMEVIHLKSNYRSHQHILDASYALIEHNYAEDEYKDLRVKLHAARENNIRSIDIVHAGNGEAEEKYFATEIQKILAEKESEKTVAVIVPTNRDVEQVLRVLKLYGVSASSERGINIFAHPAGMLFFDVLRFALDQSQLEYVAKTLAFGLWDLGFEEQVNMIKEIKSGIVTTILTKIPALKDLQKNKLALDPVAYLMYLVEVSGFIKLVAKDPASVEVWRTILALAEEISRKNMSRSVDDVITELLAYATSAKSKSIKIGVGNPLARVQVMTVHSSKGLEFDHVFMPYSVEESWTLKARSVYFVMPREKAQGDEIRDARRLFYVALTRARSHVTISLSKLETSGKTLSPLRFIEELSTEYSNQIEIPAQDEKSKMQGVASKLTDNQVMLADYAKGVLIERGLSVTALNHFLSCPSEFFYKSIMRLPEAPHPSSEKGNAMHLAISNVWKLEDKNEQAIVQTLSDTIKDYFATKSLLPLFEKEPLVKTLLEDLPSVVDCLHDHFKISGVTSTEMWFEKVTPMVRLHGRLDAVTEQETSVLVFDYKTREAMSEKQIKGETQNSDGGYFRQLVFYKILLQSHKQFSSKEIIPSLVFVRPDSRGMCKIVTLPITKEDIDTVQEEINKLVDAVMSGSFLKDVCEEPECEWCKLKGWNMNK